MDGLISVGVSVLSAHLKAVNHEVQLYDATYFDTGKKTGDFYREQMGQVIAVDENIRAEEVFINDEEAVVI